MTDQAQKLIDELPKHYYQCEACKGDGYIRNKPDDLWKDCPNCHGAGTIADKCVFIEDVIALVEKLTGWTKVEDGLPEIGKHKLSQLYNVRNKDGELLDIAGFSQQSGKWIFTNLKVSEWKPIF